MAKRKSITGMRRKPKQPSLYKPPAEPANKSSVQSKTRTSKKPPRSSSTPSTYLMSPIDRSDYLPNQYRMRSSLGPMKPRIKHVSQNTIRSKWTEPTENIQVKIGRILRSMDIPALARHTPEQKKIEAQRAMNALAQSLGKRLLKTPFPPKSQDGHFDYEELERNNRSLQRRFAASLSALTLLMDEVEKLRNAVSSEQQELEAPYTSP